MAQASYHSPTAMRICIDKISGAGINGRLFCPQAEGFASFSDFGLLLVMLEQALDEWGYPYSFQKKRSFFSQPESMGSEQFYKKVIQMTAQKTGDCHSEVFGETCTVLVHVLSRRNCCWQGKLEWLEDGALETFESDIELLYRISGRLPVGKSKAWQ